MIEAQVAGWRVGLLPERALWLTELRWLLVADAHIGKAQSFRRLGVPVPQGTTADNLTRLSALIAQRQPDRLVFLGDFLHSAHSHAAATQAAVALWRQQHRALPMTLVRGNHDDRAGDPPAALGFEVVDEPLVVPAAPMSGVDPSRWQPLHLCHHPEPAEGAYVLAGHWHPCVSLASAVDRVRLPCFWLGADVGILPAFGAFTGMHPIRRRPRDEVWAIADGRVLRA